MLRGHICTGQSLQNYVQEEPIVRCRLAFSSLLKRLTLYSTQRPSRPRELPFSFLPSKTPPVNTRLAAQPRPVTSRPYGNSYTSVGDYAPSFYHPKDVEPDVPHSLQVYLPIPDDHESSYSELAANLNFLGEVSKGAPTGRYDAAIVEHSSSSGGEHPQAQAPRTDAEPPNGVLSLEPASAFSCTYPQPSNPCHVLPESPKPHQTGLPLPSRRRKTLKKAVEALQAQNAKAVDPSRKRKYAPKPLSPGSTSPGQSASRALKKLLDPKKPKMACHFCRDRKIACGNPGEGAFDRTCE
jgi:hypothetical protein